MTDANGEMGCESVEDRLLDLVYGDVDEAEARDLRAHAEACEGCRRSLARLEGGRALARLAPVSEPGAAVLASVRAAARARAAEIEAAASPQRPDTPAGSGETSAPPQPPVDTAPERGGWWSDLLRWLGSMAMGPQVAMATLLLLMIGIGLGSLPSLRGRSGRGPGAIVEPDPAGEIGPSRALEPAEPLAFDFDPRTRRLAPIGEGGSSQQAAGAGSRSSAPPPRPAPSSPPASERRAASAADQDTDARRLARAREASPARDQVGDEGPLPRPEPAPEALALGVESELAPGEALGDPHEPAPSPERAPAAAGAYAAAEGQRPPAASSAAPPPPASPTTPEPDDEVARPQADPETALASAAHHQAREAGARGAHAECARLYQALLSRYPRYPETGRALIELAECQRRGGRLGEARRALERAERIPSVRAEASRELVRLRTMEERATAVDRAAAAVEAH